MAYKLNGAHDFVREHPKLSIDELVKAAEKAELSLTRRQLQRACWKIAHSEDTQRKKREQTKTKTKKQRKHAAAAAPALAHKQAQLRKLIFEMGWDAARDIFHEFQNMHGRWEG